MGIDRTNEGRKVGPSRLDVFWQLARYGVVGVSVNAGGYFVYLALTALSMDYRLAATLTFIGAIWASYQLNSRWTFRAGTRSLGNMTRYGFLYVATFILYIGGLSLAVEVGGMDYRIVPLIFMLIMPPFVFMLQKIFVFDRP
jgi:putative flippase GtrA